MHVKFDVFLFQDEAGAFIARVPALAGCHSWGRTEVEAMDHIQDAIRLALQEPDAPPLHRIGVKQISVEA